MNEFDSFASNYDTALNRGLAISGEDKEFFAKGRIRWLSHCLRKLAFSPRSVLDYGCGTGTATRHFFSILGAESVTGVDLSAKSLEMARHTHADLRVDYRELSQYTPSEAIDLVFCNGVFHHIVPQERLETTRFIARCVRPGGLFALWENNAWNPGTRYIMRRIPFDRDAICLGASEARSLLSKGGFRVIRIDYYFIFPAMLSVLRRAEPYMTRLPIGAQYQVLCRKEHH